MALLWTDLQPVQRQRAVVTVSPLGEAVEVWSSIQNLMMLPQPYIRDYQDPQNNFTEGVAITCTHIGYCNLQTANGSGIATDIQTLDRIVDINGIFGPVNGTWRVTFVNNAAGVADHLEVHLKTLSPLGD